MTPPAISVLLPVRNGEQTLPACLDSLVRQTETDFEIVAVNDHSDDATAAILNRWQRRHPRLQIVVSDRRGVVPALQQGLDRCRAPLIARMDADDLCDPERLSAQRHFLETHPGIDLVSCGIRYGGDREKQGGYARHVDWLNSLTTPDSFLHQRFIDAPVAHPSVMFRMEAIRTHGGYREGPFPEDYEMWLRWLQRGVRFGKVDRPLLTWNDPPGRLSRVDARYHEYAFWQLKLTWLEQEMARRQPEHLWIAPASRRSRKALAPVLRNRQISGYVDVAPQRIGSLVQGVPVLHPSQLAKPQGHTLMLAALGGHGQREALTEILADRGWDPDQQLLHLK